MSKPPFGGTGRRAGATTLSARAGPFRFRFLFVAWAALAAIWAPGAWAEDSAAPARGAEATASVARLRPDFTFDFKSDGPDAMPRPISTPWRKTTLTYPEFGAFEWALRVETTGDAVAIEDSRSAAFSLVFPAAGPIALHWSRGSHSETNDFEPLENALERGSPVEPASFGGRSSDGAMPYFNLAGDGGGVIIALGWTGDWRAKFELAEPGRVEVSAGLADADFKVGSGDGFLAMPSILMMPYKGDWIDGQNKFRRLMRAAFTPKSHPEMELMPVAASVHGMIGFNDTTEEGLTKLAEEIAALGLPLDTFWLDAGWNEGGFAGGQGNPEPDPARFPRGLGPVGEAAKRAKMRFLLWFEPERAMRGTWLDREHPDWLLRPSGCPPELKYQETDGVRLLDLGNREARRWAADLVGRQIDAFGVDIYRQDFNLYPAYFWRDQEPETERGLREVRYINGLYDYLDDLNTWERPELIIDNCASGGRRLDFEMMRRSVALWRSDSCWDSKDFPRNVQAMTHGLSLWLPFHGLGATGVDAVSLRSGMGACASFAINYRDPSAVEQLRRHLARYLPIRALYAEDYYPLTPWSTDPARWLAFQFHNPKTGEGIVQAFRGAASPGAPGVEEIRLHLRGLEPERLYRLEDWDAEGEGAKQAGAALAEPGLLVKAPAGGPAAAVVIHYRPEAP